MGSPLVPSEGCEGKEGKETPKELPHITDSQARKVHQTRTKEVPQGILVCEREDLTKEEETNKHTRMQREKAHPARLLQGQVRS